MTQGETLEEEIPRSEGVGSRVAHGGGCVVWRSSQYCYGDVPVSMRITLVDITSRYVIVQEALGS